MRRIVSVWLIDWPVTVWSRTAGRAAPADDQPFALVARGPRGLALHALNRAARRAGLAIGQPHADARAILPGLLSAPAEPAREAEAIERLAHWCESWSPVVAIDRFAPAMDGLLIDMTGGTHLFGDEAALIGDIARRLRAARVPARVAIADTPGAAWAAARFARGDAAIVPAGAAREALAELSVAALRIDPPTLALAQRFGLRRIGDLYPLPRAKLARRFRDGDALGLVRRLDQALGLEPELLAAVRPMPRHRAAAIFAEPLTDMAGIDTRLERLAPVLAARLAAAGEGASALTLTGFRVDGGASALGVRLGRPSREVTAWLRLFRERGLDRIDPGFGIDALVLAAITVAPLAAVQPGLDGAVEGVAEKLAGLVDRLSARLGEDAVLAARGYPSWLPERSQRWVPALAAIARFGQAPPIDDGFARPRPLLLLDPPERIEPLYEVPDGAPRQFRWRRVLRRVARAEGPERLAPEWWRGSGRRTRDYYRVEDEAGSRYWLFREGLIDRAEAGDGGAPDWWMHGLFA